MRQINTTTQLLPHQQAAVDKVRGIKVSGLFMDMGTGKTRTVIELAKLRAPRIDHVLWICPVSLKETVRREIMKHTDCTPEDIYVFGDKTDSALPKDKLWYIVGIESFSSSSRVTMAANAIITDKTFVVMDESSYIKGHNAIRTRRVTLLAEKAKYRTILTGTPLTQGIVDLFSQMYFLSPKILGYKSFYSFEANHLEYHPKRPGLVVRAHNVPYLAEKIKPYVYQCTKDECMEIPDKLYKTRWVRLTDEQEEAYEAAKEKFEHDMDELESRYTISYMSDDYPDSFWRRSSMLIFRLFTSLQTIVCGFERVRTGRDSFELRRYDSRRTEALLDVVRSLPEDKVIVWAKYLNSIEDISEALCEEYGKEKVCLYHGGLNAKQRDAELDRFEAKDGARFLVATQSCGGHGLNLQFCRWQIFFANGFKYSERLQAEDRCHRHGQRRHVTYIDLCASDTIDEKIDEALAKKGSLLDAFRREVKRIKDDKNTGKADKVKKLKEMVRKL